MEIYLLAGAVVLLIIFGMVIAGHSNTKRKVFKNNSYQYITKQSPMTVTESEFFFKLERIVSDRYFIFPQVHLSSIFDHRIKGQEWKFAFSHINGKSVDYLLCDKETLLPTYAIELDDYTHERSDRRERDAEVERIFEYAKLPLIRIKNKNVSEEEIIAALKTAHSQFNNP